MKDKVYITIIALLGAVAVFFFLSHKRDCRQLESCAVGCMQQSETGHHGKGKGRGMGLGMNAGKEAGQARNDLFSLVVSGSSDTALLFMHLEKIVDVQRQNQKRTLLKILSIRDSLNGDEKEAFLKTLNKKFCGQTF